MKLTFVMRPGSCAAVLLLLLATSAQGQGGRTQVTAQTLHKIFAAEWDYDMEQYPTWASTLGDRRWNHRWENLSMDAILKRHERHREVLARLVVDTGIHYLRWERQKAIDFMIENTAKHEHEVIAEVDRYIVWPGQALAYKIGQLKIAALRAKTKQTLGDQFDIRDFHDELLKDGPLPLDRLEEKIEAWIVKQKLPKGR